MKFRHKPTVVKAVQWDGTDEAFAAIRKFNSSIWRSARRTDDLTMEQSKKTLTINLGSWVVVRAKGDLAFYSERTFPTYYEPLEEP